MIRFAICVAFGFMAIGPATAATVDAGGMLRQFNTIALNTLTTSNESEGPVYVGGDLTLTATTQLNNDTLPEGSVGPVSGALVVGGNVQGGQTLRTLAGGTVIGGAIATGTTVVGNGNGGTDNSVITGATDIPVSAVTAAFEALSQDLRFASTTDTIEIRNVGADFSACQTISGSNQTEREPRCLSDAL